MMQTIWCYFFHPKYYMHQLWLARPQGPYCPKCKTERPRWW